MITLQQLTALFPHSPSATLEAYVDPLNKTFTTFHIDQPLRMRAFLAQAGHESGGFVFKAENLNYSKDALLRVFPRYFNASQAVEYARDPEKIANRVYANRMGNRDEASGDGWKYRGRGCIQITGANNYRACAVALGMSLDDCVGYLETDEGAAMSAGWFWSANSLNRLADGQDMLTITRRINGGTNGLQDRMDIWNRSRLIIR